MTPKTVMIVPNIFAWLGLDVMSLFSLLTQKKNLNKLRLQSAVSSLRFWVPHGSYNFDASFFL
jgi:hypothetical protein